MTYIVKYETLGGDVRTDEVHGYDMRDAIKYLSYKEIYFIRPKDSREKPTKHQAQPKQWK